jgi:hypothetical protein
MEDSAYRAVVRRDYLPTVLAVADAASSRQGDGGDGRSDGSWSALAHSLYEEVMFFTAGTVVEEKIAGYRVDYVEVDVAGRTSVDWDAVRVARLEAGLPICGHKDCEIPFDAGRDAGRIAEVIQRAENEVFGLLKANWLAVEAQAALNGFLALLSTPRRAMP